MESLLFVLSIVFMRGISNYDCHMEDIIIHGRERDLGGFLVHRSLPSAQRRFCGPFVFLDHMGPMEVTEERQMNVRPHPHIGLATVTYLFDGRGYHRDSIGSKQMITPGDLNWMTAGRGIVHSERTPKEDQVAHPHKWMHGVQIWVGLPVEHEECEPTFAHWPSDKMPRLKFGKNINAKVMIGEHGEAKSPVKCLSRTLFMDIPCEQAGHDKWSFNEQELGLFLVNGSATINGHELKGDDLILVADPKNIDIQYAENTRILAIGGEPFPEPRHIWWNFVSSSKERIHQAAAAWKDQTFGHVEGEVDFIPLPNDKLP